MPLKPRITLVGPWPPTQGGVTTFMLNVAHSALAERYTFIPFTVSRPPKSGLSSAYGYGAMFRGGLWSFCVSVVVTAWHVVKFPFAVLRADVVQVQASDFQAFWEAAFYVSFCRMIRRPVLMRIGGSFDRFYESSSPRVQRLIRRVLAWPDRVIVQSAFWANYVAMRGRTEGVVLLPNSIADELLEPVERSARSTCVCLFLAGSEAVRKGALDVIGAAGILKARSEDIRIRVVAASNELRYRFADEYLANMVELEGSLDREGVTAAMRRADIFLLPSHSEGFPNSLLEAMATGLASIVTPVGAVPEIVGENGAVTIPVMDPEALADAISRLAGDPALRTRIAAAGRAIVAARYTHGIVLPTLDAAWRSLLERR